MPMWITTTENKPGRESVRKTVKAKLLFAAWLFVVFVMNARLYRTNTLLVIQKSFHSFYPFLRLKNCFVAMGISVKTDHLG